jgi:hypothetical protein
MARPDGQLNILKKGASSIRHSLRPRFFEGARIFLQTSGAWRRENAKARLPQSSSPAKAGAAVRRGFSVQSLASLEYWVARSSPIKSGTGVGR